MSVEKNMFLFTTYRSVNSVIRFVVNSLKSILICFNLIVYKVNHNKYKSIKFQFLSNKTI